MNMKNKEGISALMNATCKGYDKYGLLGDASFDSGDKYEVVDLLLKAGADVNASSTFRYYSID